MTDILPCYSSTFIISHLQGSGRVNSHVCPLLGDRVCVTGQASLVNALMLSGNRVMADISSSSSIICIISHLHASEEVKESRNVVDISDLL